MMSELPAQNLVKSEIDYDDYNYVADGIVSGDVIRHEVNSCSMSPMMALQDVSSAVEKDDFFDSEHLIIEVKKRPELYDSSLKEYHDRYLKGKAWIEICTEIVPFFENMINNEKNLYVREIQKRWRSLRDCFHRDLKLSQSKALGSSAKKKRRYIYFNQLSFLEPVIKHRQTTGTVSLDDEIREEDFSDSKTENEDETACHIEEDSPIRVHKQKVKEQKDSFEDNLLKILANKRQPIPQEEDPDRMFFLSMLPAYKKLSFQNKLVAQIEVIKIIQKLTEQQCCHNSPNQSVQSTSENSLEDSFSESHTLLL